MFKNISLGIYYPGDSILHRLQARTKLLLIMWFIVCLMFANQHEWHFLPYIAAALLLFAGVAISGSSPRHMWQRMRLLVLLAFIGAIPTVFFPDSTGRGALSTFGPFLFSYGLLQWILLLSIVAVTIYVLLFLLPVPALRNFQQRRWLRRIRILLLLIAFVAAVLLWFVHDIPSGNTFPLGPIKITYDGVWLLMSIFVVFLLFYGLSLLLTMTTSPIALIEGIRMLLGPLRRLRLPVDDFALMMLIALRFIPTLIEEAEQLVKAQMARGADFSHGKLTERGQSLAALFIPFVQGTMRRAADLATALEARGYEVDGRQTSLHEKSPGMLDFVVFGVAVLVMVGALVL